MNYRIPSPDQQGYCALVRPGMMGIERIEFGLLKLSAGDTHTRPPEEKEVCGVILSGVVDVTSDRVAWKDVGARRDVFSGKASAFYLPPGWPARITARTAALVALCGAASTAETEPFLVTPDRVLVTPLGCDNWRREKHDIIAPEDPADRLIVGETYGPPGNWSSYPPHRHDHDNPPKESKLEEVYYFRIDPPKGFAFQRMYDDEGSLDETYAIKDGDTLAIPRGYHPVAAAPGYSLYYLWVLAGETRRFLQYYDPTHDGIQR